eukprot:scaffold6554_cov307-Chaetoceros_neogracile.AAC.3
MSSADQVSDAFVAILQLFCERAEPWFYGVTLPQSDTNSLASALVLSKDEVKQVMNCCGLVGSGRGVARDRDKWCNNKFVGKFFSSDPDSINVHYKQVYIRLGRNFKEGDCKKPGDQEIDNTTPPIIVRKVLNEIVQFQKANTTINILKNVDSNTNGGNHKHVILPLLKPINQRAFKANCRKDLAKTKLTYIPIGNDFVPTHRFVCVKVSMKTRGRKEDFVRV